MNPHPVCFIFLTLWLGNLLPGIVRAQQPAVAEYRARVITQTGKRFRGILEEVTEGYLYVNNRNRKNLADFMSYEEIPASVIRKVVVRRVNKRSAIISGAIVGGLVTGFLSNESLKRNRPGNTVAYGLTLTFSAAGGAAAGLLLGSAVGSLTGRVVRPLDRTNPGVSLFRQLEPLSVRYQQDLINRLPKNQ